MSFRIRLRGVLNGRSTLAARLSGWFQLIALVPCISLLLLTSLFSSRSLQSTVRDRLTLICDAKALQLERYITERLSDAQLIATAPAFVVATDRLDAMVRDGKAVTEEYRREVEAFRPRLAAFAKTKSYANLILLNLQGVSLASAEPGLDLGTGLETGPLKGSQLAEAFQAALKSLTPQTTKFQIYPGRKEGVGFVVGPILKGGAATGIVALELKNADVFQSVNSYLGLGQTGDITLATEDEKGIVYVAATRFDPDAAFRDRLALGAPNGKDMQLAVRGERGYGEMVDHLGNRVVTAWAYLPTLRWGLTVKQDVVEAFDLIHQQRVAAVTFMLAAAVLVFLAARLVARSITRPIREAVQVAERVAAGDLTARIESSASGEVGQLLRAIESMTADLRSLIGRIQQSSTTLMSTATEISATAHQQGEAVSDYGASTSEAAAAVKQITATSFELLKTMNEVNHVAGQTSAVASGGQANLAEMGRSMQQLADSTGSIGAKLSVISERAGNINLAVTTIAKVADQTNLLSINAAIEAEKAGTYGLGFLVVAREIRRLADQTAVATLDIERMVKEMQYSVSAGVMEMDKFTDQVRRGVDEVGAVSDQLGGIIGSVRGLTGRFEQVNEGMRVQAQGAEQIREAVIRLSEGAHQTSISLHEFNRATDYLRDAVGGLNEDVSHFNVESITLTLPARRVG